MWKWLSMVLIWASRILCRVKLYASLKSQTLRFTVEFLSIKYVRIWKIDGFVLIKPILYKPLLTNTSYVIFLLVFDNPCKTSVLYLALFRGRRAIRTRILQLILSHNNVIPLWLWTLKIAAQSTPMHIEKKFCYFCPENSSFNSFKTLLLYLTFWS